MERNKINLRSSSLPLTHILYVVYDVVVGIVPLDCRMWVALRHTVQTPTQVIGEVQPDRRLQAERRTDVVVQIGRPHMSCKKGKNLRGLVSVAEGNRSIAMVSRAFRGRGIFCLLLFFLLCDFPLDWKWNKIAAAAHFFGIDACEIDWGFLNLIWI